LRKQYKISDEEKIYIKKIDVKQEGLKIPKVEYDVYYPFTPNNLTKLNLTVCQNTKVDISIPAIIPINELDKYNKSSALYNDICYTLKTESDTDITLRDRQNEYVENSMSICEEDCEFSKYDEKKL